MNGQKPREIAAQVLAQRTRFGVPPSGGAAVHRPPEGGTPNSPFIENLLERALAGAKLSPADRGLCQELVYGVVRWQVTLDWLIARKTQGRTQKTTLQDLLRLGLYQIFWLDRIPDHAAVNETVEMAKQRGFGAQAGFVNAVLRGYLREQDETKKLLAESKVSQPAVGWSHPEWLVARWQKRWGDERTRQLLEWNNTPPKTFARINTLKADPGKLLIQWRDEHVEYDFVRRDWFEENLIFDLKSFPSLSSLPSFQQGQFYIQDPSTLLAVHELNPQPGETILDFCAAPGGKTTFIAQRMNNQGRIVAHDLSADRVKLVEENCSRLGVTCVEVRSSRREEAQTSKSKISQSLLTSAATEFFDKVLLDAPCSNTGVMRRRVDLRWRIQPEEIQRLREVQLDLLKQAATFVKPGGVLVYSTCSLEPEENSEVVKEFLSQQPGFKLERERELLPFSEGVDGAYVAALVRAQPRRFTFP